jgi:cell division protein FtsB
LVKTNGILKLSRDEIQALNESLSQKKKELEIIEKDRTFFKRKVERLEEQLFQKEKNFLRNEAEKEVDAEERYSKLANENDALKEELIGTFV